MTLSLPFFFLFLFFFISFVLLRRCLSEKEIQLECMFDGEIGSVVSAHFSFFVSLWVISLCFSL